MVSVFMREEEIIDPLNLIAYALHPELWSGINLERQATHPDVGTGSGPPVARIIQIAMIAWIVSDHWNPLGGSRS
jgi:hypothetical protein